MIIGNFLRSRESVRDFRDKPANPDVLDKIRDIIKELSKDEGMKYIEPRLYENGKSISSNLEGKAGYGGVMINSPHYIAVDIKNDDNDTMIRAGYYMEKLATEIINLDFGTCWIQLGNVSDDLKKKTFGGDIKHLDYLLAFGREKRKSPFVEKSFSIKRGVEELVYDTQINRFFTIEDLENKGLMDIFYYVRFAPSTKNLQPCRFLVKDDRIELLLRYREWYDSIFIDAGIVMYYFEQLAKYEGMDGEWELIDYQKEVIDGCTYKTIAKFQL